MASEAQNQGSIALPSFPEQRCITLNLTAALLPAILDRAWKVPAAELLANGCNLDRKNPNAKENAIHLPPERLAANILEKERRIARIIENIQNLLAKKGA